MGGAGIGGRACTPATRGEEDQLRSCSNTAPQGPPRRTDPRKGDGGGSVPPHMRRECAPQPCLWPLRLRESRTMCVSFLCPPQHARGLLRCPRAERCPVLAPRVRGHLGPPAQTGPCGTVPSNPSLEGDLPRVLSRLNKFYYFPLTTLSHFRATDYSTLKNLFINFVEAISKQI